MENTQLNSKASAFSIQEITIVVGDTIGENCRSSIRYACDIAKDGRFGKVIFFNTVQTERKMVSVGREVLVGDYDIANENITFETADIGETLSLSSAVREHVTTGHAVIVINSWEFASREPRQRDRLLFQLKEWINKFGLTVIIFMQKHTLAPCPGSLQRRGAGKLSAISDRVLHVTDHSPNLALPDAGAEACFIDSSRDGYWNYPDPNLLRFAREVALAYSKGMLISEFKKNERERQLSLEKEAKAKRLASVTEAPVKETPVVIAKEPTSAQTPQQEYEVRDEINEDEEFEEDDEFEDEEDDEIIESFPELKSAVTLEDFMKRFRGKDSVSVHNQTTEKYGVAEASGGVGEVR